MGVYIKNIYERIKTRIDKIEAEQGFKVAAININMVGTLNGKAINKKLNSFHAFDAELIPIFKPQIECKVPQL